jgi:hypothetical protein
LLTLLAAGASLPSQPALAAGCGGYVNVFVSGCAPWDNNPRRMPGAPGYQAPRPTVQQAPRITTPTIASRIQPQAPVARPQVTPTGNRLITDNGAGLRQGGNILSDQGGGLRRGGNILSDQGGGLRR